MFDLKGREVHDGHVTLSNFSYDVIYEMVHFMYSGYSPNLNRLCADLFIASDYVSETIYQRKPEASNFSSNLLCLNAFL